MLRQAIITQSDIRMGGEFVIKGTILGHRLPTVQLPLMIRLREITVTGEKITGKVAFQQRESFPIPAGRPRELLNGSGLAVLRDRWTDNLLEISKGTEAGDPLNLQLVDGFGGGPLSASVNGNIARVDLYCRKGTTVEIERRDGQLVVNYSII